MKGIKTFAPAIKAFSEALVFADINDLQSLSNLHSRIEELMNALEKANLQEFVSPLQAASVIVEKLVLGEITDIPETMKILNETASIFQLMADGKNGDAISFPEALSKYKIASTITKPEAKPVAAAQKEIKKKQETEDPDEKMRIAIRSSTAAAMNSDPELLADFINESIEHLDGCNEHLLTLESAPDNYDALNAIFRAFHTIKGVASFLNLNEIRKLAHQTENLFDKARSGKLILSGSSMDVTFEAVDTMKLMIDDLSKSLSSGNPQSSVKNINKLFNKLEIALSSELQILSKMKELEAHPKQPAPAPVPDQIHSPDLAERRIISREDFEKKIDLSETCDIHLTAETFSSELPQFIEEIKEQIETAEEVLLDSSKGMSGQEQLNSIFRAFHTIKGSSALLGFSAIEKLAHRAETLLDYARNGKLNLAGESLDTVFNCLDAFKYILDTLVKSVSKTEKNIILPEFKEIILDIDKIISASPSEKTIQELAPVPVQTPEPDTHPAALARFSHDDADGDIKKAMNETQSINKKMALKEIVKVDADRLDRLIDMIGELVIAETMVTQSQELKQINSQHLSQNIGHLDKITRELQAMGTFLRMVPLHATFQKMARLVRDLSKKLGKDIEFIMNGEETELDKNVVDKIGDPLVHMVRNAIDHGIEKNPHDRINAGKTPKAQVTLRAFHKGGSIFIEVQDDGRGINKAAVYKKAVERGIIEDGTRLSDKEIFNLLFAPGFSTAEAITEVSGRGVGMDVVKRNIEALRGQVDIQSEEGKGSIFSIRLPLTLAIIDGMVVNVRGERYIIPTLSILMSVRVARKNLKTVQAKGQMLSIQNELITVFDLARIFQSDTTTKTAEDLLIVIVEDNGEKTGIVVDELLGQQQIVIKNLGEYLKGIPGIAGGAIMPDGTVGLILDIGGLVKLANSIT